MLTAHGSLDFTVNPKKTTTNKPCTFQTRKIFWISCQKCPKSHDAPRKVQNIPGLIELKIVSKEKWPLSVDRMHGRVHACVSTHAHFLFHISIPIVPYVVDKQFSNERQLKVQKSTDTSHFTLSVVMCRLRGKIKSLLWRGCWLPLWGCMEGLFSRSCMGYL